MRTLADLTGTTPPDDADGFTILPEILGDTEDQEQHEMLYWEYREQTAVRFGNWKAIQPKRDKPWELYDLAADIEEANSIAYEHPDILAKMKEFAVASHTPVRIGSYSDPDRVRHERDRWAKWGTSGEDPRKKKK